MAVGDCFNRVFDVKFSYTKLSVLKPFLLAYFFFSEKEEVS